MSTRIFVYIFRLGDEGVQPILKSLVTNSTMTFLNVASNDFTEASAPALAEVILDQITLILCQSNVSL